MMMQHSSCGWQGEMHDLNEVYFRGKLVDLECPKCGESCPFFGDESWEDRTDDQDHKWIPRNRDKKNGARNEGDH